MIIMATRIHAATIAPALGLLAPAATPREIVERMAKAVKIAGSREE
jgi:hypothetical protein